MSGRRKMVSQMTDDELDALYDQLDLVRGILRSLRQHPEDIEERVARGLDALGDVRGIATPAAPYRSPWWLGGGDK